MYEFNATVTNDYTIEVTSNTYWSCKAEGNFKLSSYNGEGNAKIDIEIPDDNMMVDGVVYFSYGDERCKYPVVYVNLTNTCYIETTPNYNICKDKKTIFLFYKEPFEAFKLSVFCFDGWSVDATDFKYIKGDNEVMIISNGRDGEVRIIPEHKCNGKNIVYIKLLKNK